MRKREREGKKGRIFAGVLWAVVIILAVILVISIITKAAFEHKIEEVNSWQSQVISGLDRTRTNLATEALRIAGNKVIIGFVSKENPSNMEVEQVKREFELKYSGEVEIEDALVIDRSTGMVFSNEQIQRVAVEEYVRGGYDLQSLLDKYSDSGNCYVSIEAWDGSNKQFYVYMTTERHLIVFELDKVSVKKLCSGNTVGDADTCIYYNGLAFISVGDADVLGEGIYLYMRERKLQYMADQDYITIFFRRDRTAGLSRIGTWEFAEQLLAEIWLWILLCLVTGLSIGLILWKYLKRMNFLNIQQSLEMALMRKRMWEINQQSALIKGFLGMNLQQDEYITLEQYFTGDDADQEKCGWRCVIFQLLNENTMGSLGTYGVIEQYSETICNVSKSFTNLEKNGFVSLNHQTLGMVVGRQGKISEDDLLDVIKQVQEKFWQERQVSVSVVVSELCNNCDDFLEKAPETYRMSEYTFFCGTGKILLQKDFEEWGIIPYPVMIERSILSELEKKNAENYKQQIERFLERIRQTSPTVARCYLSVLATNMVNYTKLGVNPINSNVVQQIVDSDTLETAKAILYNLAADTPEKEEKKEAEFFKAVSALIEKEFSDPDFCLSDVATHMDITASYAGKKFRQSFHQSFNAYLTDFRVSKALQLLQTTNHKIKDVGELCGFRTTAYFVTVFKKQMEVSPQEYRKNNWDANI